MFPLGLRVRVGRCRAQARGRQRRRDVGLDAVDLRVAAVLDDREAVLAEEAELELLPDLVIDRAVPAQRPELRLPPGFVIGEEVRVVGRRARLAVDAARTEAARPGRVEHQVLGRLPLRVEAVDEAVALALAGDCLAVHDVADVGARGARHAAGGEAPTSSDRRSNAAR